MSFLTKYRTIFPLILVAAALFVTPAHASFPGKNGRIAFVLGPDIYTMSAALGIWLAYQRDTCMHDRMSDVEIRASSR